jgi:hypothetical protein
MKPISVPPNFPRAIERLFPNANWRTDWSVENNNDGKGDVLVLWAIDAPIPTDAEIEAALLTPDKVDNVTDLKTDIEALVARLAVLEAK